MGSIRGFSIPEGRIPRIRNIEDAPAAMRQELLDAFYLVAAQTQGRLDVANHLYLAISQCLGVQAAGNPIGGRRQRLGRDLGNADWPRIYDLIVRLWPEFQRVGLHEIYREAVNGILAAHAVAWDLGADGRLHRVLPDVAHAQVQAAITELSAPRYAPALALANAARDAYDARPRRDRDACVNIFQAVEAAAQIKFDMRGRAFEDVVAALQRRQVLNAQLLGILEGLNVLRHRNFGHGMAQDFRLSSPEVDFLYLACVGAIVLLTRTP